MKKVLYSALAAACAIAGIAASKAEANKHRVTTTFYFRYLGPTVTPTTHDVTLTTNWTFTHTAVSGGGVSCNDTNIRPCGLSTTTAYTTAVSGRKLPNVPSVGKISSQNSLTTGQTALSTSTIVAINKTAQ
jgi:hypothetical protein